MTSSDFSDPEILRLFSGTNANMVMASRDPETWKAVTMFRPFICTQLRGSMRVVSVPGLLDDSNGRQQIFALMTTSTSHRDEPQGPCPLVCEAGACHRTMFRLNRVFRSGDARIVFIEMPSDDEHV